MNEWPQAKMLKLQKLWNAGTATKIIAKQFGTTVNNIGVMVRNFRDRGVDLKIRYNTASTPMAFRNADVEKRKCLGWCGKEFSSTHMGNRFCPACDKRRKAA